ncbi:hypothetical protein, partial [Bradyrhizobium sp. BRP22]|uniref:hypothetical protein n=1 Tax=Bradyrhizobium sp. BRP22 TaxID=2793821 RepID=UPI001CD39E34
MSIVAQLGRRWRIQINKWLKTSVGVRATPGRMGWRKVSIVAQLGRRWRIQINKWLKTSVGVR